MSKILKLGRATVISNDTGLYFTKTKHLFQLNVTQPAKVILSYQFNIF